MESEEKQKWMDAMQDEIKSLHDNHTYDLVNLPNGKKVLENRWINRIKQESNSSYPRYKARLVVKGFRQRKGVDFNEIFSLVVKMSSIRIVLSLAATFDLEVEQMDWYKKFEYVMCEQDYKTTFDHCVFVRKFSDDDFVILLLYVDDMLIDGKSNSRIDKFKKQLSESFATKDMGAAKQILGIRIIRDRHRFHMENAKAMSTPLATHFKLSSGHSFSNEVEKTNMSRVPYASVVGSLMYAKTRYCTCYWYCQ
ncbi:hypothetical protein CR513_35145, partial [Mucuna pruriens]